MDLLWKNIFSINISILFAKKSQLCAVEEQFDQKKFKFLTVKKLTKYL